MKHLLALITFSYCFTARAQYFPDDLSVKHSFINSIGGRQVPVKTYHVSGTQQIRCGISADTTTYLLFITINDLEDKFSDQTYVACLDAQNDTLVYQHKISAMPEDVRFFRHYILDWNEDKTTAYDPVTGYKNGS